MSRDVDKISAKLDLVLAEMALIKKTVNRLDRRGRTSRVKRQRCRADGFLGTTTSTNGTHLQAGRWQTCRKCRL